VIKIIPSSYPLSHVDWPQRDGWLECEQACDDLIVLACIGEGVLWRTRWLRRCNCLGCPARLNDGDTRHDNQQAYGDNKQLGFQVSLL